MGFIYDRFPHIINIYMCVSKNRGTPKWMVKTMENLIQIDDLEVTPLFSETCIYPPPKTYMTMQEKRHFFNRRYVFIHGWVSWPPVMLGPLEDFTTPMGSCKNPKTPPCQSLQTCTFPLHCETSCLGSKTLVAIVFLWGTYTVLSSGCWKSVHLKNPNLEEIFTYDFICYISYSQIDFPQNRIVHSSFWKSNRAFVFFLMKGLWCIQLKDAENRITTGAAPPGNVWPYILKGHRGQCFGEPFIKARQGRMAGGL